MELSFLSEFIDIGIMIALVGIIQMFKRADKNADQKNIFYMIMFIIICLPAAIAISMQDGDFSAPVLTVIGSIFIRFIKYAGLGTVFYKLVARWIDKKNEGGDE